MAVMTEEERAGGRRLRRIVRKRTASHWRPELVRGPGCLPSPLMMYTDLEGVEGLVVLEPVEEREGRERRLGGAPAAQEEWEGTEGPKVEGRDEGAGAMIMEEDDKGGTVEGLA